jgi:hypothetical protein
VYSWSQIFVVFFGAATLINGLRVNQWQAREIAYANERSAKLEKDAAEANSN